MNFTEQLKRVGVNRACFVALQFLATSLAAEEPLLVDDLITVDDGRATIQDLYETFGALQARGWVFDVIAYSRPEGADLAIPIIALRTEAAGPAVWVICGIHGEEPAGPNAIAAAIDLIAATGEDQPMVLIPLANPQGYVRNWRYLNTPVWSEETEAQSVGDSSHLLVDPERPDSARAPAASSPEANALTQYILDTTRDYPPLISIDLHEDDKINEGYVYSQGSRGADEPLASGAVTALRDSGVAVKMDGQTRFEETIVSGIIGPVTDSSVDELMSADEIIQGAAISPGPAAPIVLVIETPAAALPLESRIGAQQAVLERLLRSYPTSNSIP
jgi:hypothetical protein